MKKYFAFAIASVALTVGCQKSEVVVDPTEDGTPVQLVLGSSVATLQTKAALDAFTGSEELVIYGFEKGADLSKDASYLVKGVTITSKTSPTEDITIANTFYGTGGEKYDFYGYYATGAENGEVSKTETQITIPVKITGQEDLLIGKTTTPGTDVLGTLTAADLYSAKSARKGIKPHLKFDHQLVRFDFKLVNGTDIPEDSDKTISVDKITVTSQNTGKLVIDPAVPANCTLVPEDTDAEDDLLTIPSNGTDKLATFDKNSTDKAVEVSESVMVMPGKTEYPVALTISQTGTGAPAAAATSNLTIKTSSSDFKGFLAGFKYIVTIKVYGQEAVIVNVKLAEWQDGGSFELDPDGENVYTPGATVTPAE